MNPADFFTKKLSPIKCDFYIDIISGSAITTPGFPNSLPDEIKNCLISESMYADHIPKYVHLQPTQDKS